MISFGIYLAERGLVPDSLLRLFIKRFSLSRLREANNDDAKRSVIDGLNDGPIAENTIDANEQHYEVPAEYFKAVPKKVLKNSMITPIFKEFKNGAYKIVMTYAKRARGLMVRYIIENNINTLEELKGLSLIHI